MIMTKSTPVRYKTVVRKAAMKAAASVRAAPSVRAAATSSATGQGNTWRGCQERSYEQTSQDFCSHTTGRELNFRANKPIFGLGRCTTAYYWMGPRAKAGAKFRTFKESSEIGMKLRLAQTLKRVLCSVILDYPSPAKRIGPPAPPSQSSDFLKQRQHGVEVPAVVVGPVSADADHAIDSAASPQHLALPAAAAQELQATTSECRSPEYGKTPEDLLLPTRLQCPNSYRRQQARTDSEWHVG